MTYILIVGYLESDSGKTVLASSLISALRRAGFNSVGFKPIGATDLWFKPWIVEESKKRRILVTYDSIILERASQSSLEAYIINPIGGLLASIDPSRLEWRDSIVDLHMVNPTRRLALLRVTSCTETRANIAHIINTSIRGKITGYLSQLILDLILYLKPQPVQATIREIEAFMENEAAQIADTCMGLLEDREIIVIESNSDIAAPTYKSLDSSIVIAVAPTIAAVIDGDRYSKAVKLRSISGKPWSVRVKEVLALTKTKYTIELQPKIEPLEGYTQEELTPIIEEVKTLVKR